MRRTRKSWPGLVSFAIVATVGAGAVGCNGSGGDVFFFDVADVGLAAHSPAVVAHSSGQMALQAALAAMEPGAFPGIQGTRPNVSYSGTATNGSVVLDFGSSGTSGTEISDVTLRGELQATYVRNGANATVTVTYTTLVARTDHLGSVLVDGTITYGCTISGTTVTGTITASVDTDSSSDLSTFTSTSLSFTLSAAGTNVVSGSSSVQSTARGTWTLTHSNVTFGIDPPTSRVISSGSAVVTRTSGSALGVSLLFTGPDSGTLTVSPGGSTRSFEL